mmetsp:Transcript_11603/g.33394  ORF Transcript_11603/g.33394 Transcript_11603/m.33394 type:complete len:157 (-) Transcript_11603:1472-1942(-)
MMQIQSVNQRLVTLSRRTIAKHYGRPDLSVANKNRVNRHFSGGGSGNEEGSMHLVKAGLPLFLFCGLGVWVVSNGIEGKNRERDAFQGRISKSERQAVMDKEHDEMMDKLNYMMKEDFDNTKRIERPDEVLARRRKEREDRNVWYRRMWRNITGGQ